MTTQAVVPGTDNPGMLHNLSIKCAVSENLAPFYSAELNSIGMFRTRRVVAFMLTIRSFMVLYTRNDDRVASNDGQAKILRKGWKGLTVGPTLFVSLGSLIHIHDSYRLHG